MNTLRLSGSVAVIALLAACGGGSSPTPTATPSPAATTAPGATTPQSFSYDVEPCFKQIIPGTGGKRMRDLIVPDAVTFDLSRPADFPNGRDLDDQTVDITLAFLFLDLSASGQSLRTFANLPINPPGSDRAPISTFPYLAPPQGNPPRALTTGTSFNFRTDPDSAFVSVDRMGMPAVAPAIIGGPMRIPYNDASQTADLAGTFRAEQTLQLQSVQCHRR